MITKYVNGNALNATERVLFVPVPIEDTTITGGFAKDVFDRFPLVKTKFLEQNGFDEAQVIMVGELGGQNRWAASPYSIALAGIHRVQPGGWNLSHEFVTGALDEITRIEHTGTLTVATAGIPGTGLSGLKGNAHTELIRKSMQQHDLSITVYRDNLAGDRAAVLAVQPDLSGISN